MHCAVAHWQKLSDANQVSADGWLRMYEVLERSNQRTFFRGLIRDMDMGRRPIEKPALVVGGAVFFQDRKIRAFLKKWAFGHTDPILSVAAIYGLGAHMDDDENLRERLLIQSMKWKAIPKTECIAAVSDVFFIWDTSNGSGTCSTCGKTLG